MSAEYPGAAETFAAADAKLELAKALLDRALPVAEGDPAWVYLTKTRKLPATAVRAALPEIRLIEPLIEGRPASDYGVASLLRDLRDGAVAGLQLTFVNQLGVPSAVAPKRQSYALRQHGVRDVLFGPLGPAGEVAYLCEGRLEKCIALAAAGLGPAYGGGGRTILGYAVPRERQVVVVTDRRPDGDDAGGEHDRDYKRACDLLQIAGCAVSLTPDPLACTHNCKDVDAVLVKHGEILLQEWISRAEPIGSLSLDGEARRIARIADPLERAQASAAAAKRLKVPVGEFREAVRRHHDGAKRRGAAAEAEDTAAGSSVAFEELTPAAEPQDGAELLDDVAAAIRRHAFLTEADRVKAVLWTVHGHRRLLGNVTVLPRLIVTAAAEDSGKTTLAVAISKLSDRFEHTVDPTAAVLFRTIEAEQAGFMLDEADAWWRADDALRSIVNSGFTLEGASVLRVEDTGDGRGRRVLTPRRFSTFAPLAVVGIKLDQILPRTLISRSLVIQMRPARAGEVPADLLGDRPAVGRLRALAARLKRWIVDQEMALSVATPDLPVGLVNRIRLVWRPLLAIADRAGGDWPRLAREALEVDRARVQDRSLGEQLLLDVRDILAASGLGRMHTGDIITQLLTLELREWSRFGRAREAIRDIEVAKLLDPYEVRPVQLKIGNINRRGYRLETVAAAVARYVVPPPGGSETHYPATDIPQPSVAAAFDGRGFVAGSTAGPLPSNGGSTSDPIPATHPATHQDIDTAEEKNDCSGVAGSNPSPAEHIHDGSTAARTFLTCELCNGLFPRPPRGRPPRRCPKCREERNPTVEPGWIIQ